jgi:hypothetical protein
MLVASPGCRGSVSRGWLFGELMASASPLERTRVAGIDWVGTTIEGVRAKFPRSVRPRTKHDEIPAQARILPTRGSPGSGVRGIFHLTPIFQTGEMLRLMASQLWEAWGLTKRRRGVEFGPTLPAFALSPSERAKHLVASSIAAEGRTRRILPTFWEDRQSWITFPGSETSRWRRIASPFTGRKRSLSVPACERCSKRFR